MFPTTWPRVGLLRAAAGFFALLPLLGGTSPVEGQNREAFYRQRVVAGERAAAQGDLSAAAREFEIAAFGMLEDPPALAETLLALAEVQRRAGDREAFARTALRLVDLDEQFGVYPSLPPRLQEQKRTFEEALQAQNLPLSGTRFGERLQAVEQQREPDSKEREDAAAGKPEEIQSGPRENIRADTPPVVEDKARTQILSDQLLAEAAAGNVRRARRTARELLSMDPEAVNAQCLLRSIDRTQADCRAGLDLLAICSQRELSHLITEAHLDCADRLRDPTMIVARLEDLSPADRRRYSRDERRARRQIAKERQTSTETTTSPTTTPSTPVAPTSAPVSAEDGRRPAPPAVELPTQAPPPDPASIDSAASPVDPDSAETSDEPTPEPPIDRPIAGSAGGSPAETSKPAAASMTSSEEGGELQRLIQAEGASRTVADLESLWERALALVRDDPSPATYQVVGRLAYRTGRWASAIRYLTANGQPDDPASLFYLAVSLHQTGFHHAAAEAVAAAQPALRETPFVLGWIERIRTTLSQP